jgi:hypothetical protein
MVWYVVLHDLVPTNVWLANIKLRLPQMWKMWPTRHAKTSNDRMWECGQDLALDKEEDGVHHANGPLQHPPRLVNSPQLSLLAPHSTGRLAMDISAHGILC